MIRNAVFTVIYGSIFFGFVGFAIYFFKQLFRLIVWLTSKLSKN